MKKILIVIMLLVTSVIYAKEVKVLPVESSARNNDSGLILKQDYDDEEYTLTDSDLHSVNGWLQIQKDIPIFKFYDLQSNGTWEITDEIDRPFVIKGGNYVIYIETGVDSNKMTNGAFRYFADYTHTQLYDAINAPRHSHTKIYPDDFGIKSISSSSFFTEYTNDTSIDYTSEHLNVFFLSGTHSPWIRHGPWVPGKDNNEAGIGESLTIEFTKPRNNIVVLNGYVDPLKRHLYTANNRVKTAIIKSLDVDNSFEFEYVFEDYVHLAEINFPTEVNKVELVIKDVYEGERWNDTCITGVITRYEAEEELERRRMENTIYQLKLGNFSQLQYHLKFMRIYEFNYKGLDAIEYCKFIGYSDEKLEELKEFLFVNEEWHEFVDDEGIRKINEFGKKYGY